jgi:UDP-N-acetylmuramate--alanine ligase
MSKLELKDISRIHFIGIGGIGMSALARFFLNEKKQVSGSDRSLTPITEALQSEGVQIFTEQVTGNISDDIQMVVYTEAMAADHEEMAAAKALKVPMMNYFEALGLVANPYYLIAVAGTHGKTTTTAMLKQRGKILPVSLVHCAQKPRATLGLGRASMRLSKRVSTSVTFYTSSQTCS